ncbi:MAG: SAM-dependent methyltransferase [Candidatus Bathyarchaeota archaeon]|nr:SAM-dependent methyltransferase [Candidatus Bathyarchaeota archaeon]
MSKPRAFEISPIGKIAQTQEGWQIKILEPYRPALKELESFGHVMVLWWCHMADTAEWRQTLACNKPYRNGPEKIGVFATRSPVRPNPIAVSVTAVLGVNQEEGIVYVPWIDAAPDTPIIDLKPYHPSSDRIRDVSMPQWCSHWPKWAEDSADFDWSREFL